MKLSLSGVWLTVAATIILVATTACAQSADGNAAVAGLPLHELSVGTSGREFVFLITGDGGFATGDRGIADTFVAHGVPVVALDARAYLKQKRYPDGVANDASRIMRHYLAAWPRDSVVFVGYSRGADMAPFIITRLAPDLRDRLSLVTMIGLAERASFEFHWLDLVMDTRRSSDYPVAPEILKIHGVPMLCLYAAKDKDSLCSTFGPSVMEVEQLGGRHALSRADGVAVAERILRELTVKH
jgi:type IV secretory pathway VirJ component